MPLLPRLRPIWRLSAAPRPMSGSELLDIVDHVIREFVLGHVIAQHRLKHPTK